VHALLCESERITMNTMASELAGGGVHPVQVTVDRAIENRNRLTTAFRIILGIPHILLVGAPIALTISWTWRSDGSPEWGGGGGVLGVVALVAALIAWFAIIFTARHPAGLWNLAAFYLRWRVRAVAYLALLRDEYPPFGDGSYPAGLELEVADETHHSPTVAFRIILAIPHLIAVWALGIAWALVTLIAWLAILLTGRYPEGLYDFSLGVFRWTTRVEAYLLLLRDEYPPFSFE
jgi:hypothetical protein